MGLTKMVDNRICQLTPVVSNIYTLYITTVDTYTVTHTTTNKQTESFAITQSRNHKNILFLIFQV